MATVEHPQGPRRIGNVEMPPIDQVGYVVASLDETPSVMPSCSAHSHSWNRR